MFQHYKNVFQLSPPRAPSISLSHTRDNVLLSVSTSLGRALRSLAVLTSTVLLCACVRVVRVSLFTPFLRWYGFSPMFRP